MHVHVQSYVHVHICDQASIICFSYLGFQLSTDFVLLTEFTGKLHRAKIGIAYFYFWVISQPILALFGYLLPNWRHLLLATAVPATPLLLIWW